MPEVGEEMDPDPLVMPIFMAVGGGTLGAEEGGEPWMVIASAGRPVKMGGGAKVGGDGLAMVDGGVESAELALCGLESS